MRSLLSLNVNGEPVEVAAHQHWSLLEVLRYELGLTGSKQGCDKGDCGACTVLRDGKPVRMHINAPATPFFSMAVQKRGHVMSGMSEEVTVTFSGEDGQAVAIQKDGADSAAVAVDAKTCADGSLSAIGICLDCG